MRRGKSILPPWAASAVVIVLVSSWLPVVLGAQEAQGAPAEREIEPGDRIRFVAPPEFPDQVTGRVTALEEGMLEVDRKRSRGGPVTVQLSDVSQLEVSVERKRQTVLGLGIGTGVGLVVGGLLAWAFCEGPDAGCDPFEEAPLIIAVITVPFAALGAVLGNFTYKDVWQEAPVR